MLIVPKAIVVKELAPILCHSFRNIVQLSEALSSELTDDDSEAFSETLIVFWRLVRSDRWSAKL